MAREYQGKACPVLTAGGSAGVIHCAEEGCQWWWKCREPQGQVMLGTLQEFDPQGEAVPDIDDGRIEEYVDLEMMAKRLVNDFMVTVGNPSLGNLYYPHLETLALKALQEATLDQYQFGHRVGWKAGWKVGVEWYRRCIDSPSPNPEAMRKAMEEERDGR